MDKTTLLIAAITLILGLCIGYFIWVGIIWLIFFTFNITGYSIWLVALVSMIITTILNNMFKRS